MYNHKPDNYVCPFCLVARGIENDNVITNQEDVIYHDELITAFISAGCWKNNKGHVLIIPNEHYENIYELPPLISAKIHDVEKEIALAFKEVYKCDGVSSLQHNEPSGDQDVWHYHLHVFPRYAGDNLYKTEKEHLSSRERRDFAEKLRIYFSNKPYAPVKFQKPKQLCGASVILYKGRKILLQQRKDNKCWGYHGGRVELGEHVEQTARRELYEETGLRAKSLQLFGVFSGPELHHIYPDGNEVYVIDTVYLCNDFSGTINYQKEECIDLQWFDFDKLPEALSPPIIPALRKFLRLQGCLYQDSILV